MKITTSEEIISNINSNYFFKEFTFSKNDFKALDTKQQLQFADNVIWLDDLFFVFQIKDRESIATDDIKWFENKVLKKGVKQIKSTLNYLNTYPEILIENEKGHKLDISKARICKDIKKIIIYTTNKELPESYRQRKFYESSEIGLIHLFHSEDYSWICKYLITPTEINDYLTFREELYCFDKKASNKLEEQYFLGHFLETPSADHFNLNYISNLTNHKTNQEEFDITRIIEVLSRNIDSLKNKTDYYNIIREIAKLHRSELIEFKKRFILMFDKCELEYQNLPYRIYSPKTDCTFVFLSVPSQNAKHWKDLIHNLTIANKYDQKAKKSIGIVAYKDMQKKGIFQLFWTYLESDWEYNELIEKNLKEYYPFRQSKIQRIDNPYK